VNCILWHSVTEHEHSAGQCVVRFHDFMKEKVIELFFFLKNLQ
jgi:hypothetical protein